MKARIWIVPLALCSLTPLPAAAETPDDDAWSAPPGPDEAPPGWDTDGWAYDTDAGPAPPDATPTPADCDECTDDELCVIGNGYGECESARGRCLTDADCGPHAVCEDWLQIAVLQPPTWTELAMYDHCRVAPEVAPSQTCVELCSAVSGCEAWGSPVEPELWGTPGPVAVCAKLCGYGEALGTGGTLLAAAHACSVDKTCEQLESCGPAIADYYTFLALLYANVPAEDFGVGPSSWSSLPEPGPEATPEEAPEWDWDWEHRWPDESCIVEDDYIQYDIGYYPSGDVDAGTVPDYGSDYYFDAGPPPPEEGVFDYGGGDGSSGSGAPTQGRQDDQREGADLGCSGGPGAPWGAISLAFLALFVVSRRRGRAR